VQETLRSGNTGHELENGLVLIFTNRQMDTWRIDYIIKLIGKLHNRIENLERRIAELEKDKKEITLVDEYHETIK